MPDVQLLLEAGVELAERIGFRRRERYMDDCGGAESDRSQVFQAPPDEAGAQRSGFLDAVRRGTRLQRGAAGDGDQTRRDSNLRHPVPVFW